MASRMAVKASRGAKIRRTNRHYQRRANRLKKRNDGGLAELIWDAHFMDLKCPQLLLFAFLCLFLGIPGIIIALLCFKCDKGGRIQLLVCIVQIPIFVVCAFVPMVMVLSSCALLVSLDLKGLAEIKADRNQRIREFNEAVDRWENVHRTEFSVNFGSSLEVTISCHETLSSFCITGNDSTQVYLTKREVYEEMKLDIDDPQLQTFTQVLFSLDNYEVGEFPVSMALPNNTITIELSWLSPSEVPISVSKSFNIFRVDSWVDSWDDYLYLSRIFLEVDPNESSVNSTLEHNYVIYPASPKEIAPSIEIRHVHSPTLDLGGTTSAKDLIHLMESTSQATTASVVLIALGGAGLVLDIVLCLDICVTNCVIGCVVRKQGRSSRIMP